MIHQFCFNINQIKSVSDVSFLLNYLSQERIKRFKQYHQEADKVRCIMAEILLRYSVANLYHINQQDITFGYHDFGKPFLTKYPDIHFNCSHSGDWVVCAVGDAPLGVDVETNNEFDPALVSYFLSEAELSWYNTLSDPKQRESFFQIWTLKESYVKYIGDGLNRDLSSFSFDISSDIRLSSGSNKNDDTVNFVSTKLDPKHWYALCSKSSLAVLPIEHISFTNICSLFK